MSRKLQGVGKRRVPTNSYRQATRHSLQEVSTVKGGLRNLRQKKGGPPRRIEIFDLTSWGASVAVKKSNGFQALKTLRAMSSPWAKLSGRKAASNGPGTAEEQ